jgi:hypothetical protein
MEKEIWKDIPNYENKYQVSSLGRVKSLKCGNLLSDRLTDRGYNTAVLYLNGKPKTFKVHRLVAFAFIDNKENKPFINHKDGNKLNNRIDNLEWVTHSENIRHAYSMGLNSYDRNKTRDSKGRFISSSQYNDY